MDALIGNKNFVQDFPLMGKSALFKRNEGRQYNLEIASQNLSKNPVDTSDQTDRTEVFDIIGTNILRKERNERSAHLLRQSISSGIHS